jgi:LTXXQ motif family protein
MAAPRMAPQISAPRMGTSHLAAPRMAPQMPRQLARPSGGPSSSAFVRSAPTQRTIGTQGAGPGGRDRPSLNVAGQQKSGGPTARTTGQGGGDRPNLNAAGQQQPGGPSAATVGQGGRERSNLNAAGHPQPGGPSAPNVRDPSPRAFQLAGVNQANSDRMLRNPALANRFGNRPGGTLEGRALARATFQGGFANHWWKHNHHHRFFKPVFVIGFVGPLFWPYAYNDFVDYTFYPYAYDTFWPSAYDDVYAGMFGPYAMGYGGGSYRSAGRPQGSAAYTGGGGGRAAGGPVAADLCTGQTAGLTDWPIDRIAQTVEPNDAQRATLDELRAATATSLDILKAACPTDLPSTPIGRLNAMQKRLDAMLQAVRTVRPALETFYQSLNDEQKARFNALGPDDNQQQARRDLTQMCGERAAGIGSLPTERIERAVRPTDAQRATLKELQDAMADAGNVLKSDCPTYRPLTPIGRLEAMEQRLNAMLRAVTTVQPALDRFYSVLSDEQKERFNRLGPPQA